MIYQTRQRRDILAFFENTPHQSHSAREVIEALSANRTVSEATVFRTLTHLTEEGILRRFTEDGRAVYQYCHRCAEDCDAHMHLKCKVCGAFVHLECSFADEIWQHFATEHHFKLDREETVLYGICEACGKEGSAVTK